MLREDARDGLLIIAGRECLIGEGYGYDSEDELGICEMDDQF